MKKLSLAALFFFIATSALFSVPSELDYGYSENHPLYFGNPSDAQTDENESWNYLLEKTQFCASYNSSTLTSNWVAWHLSAGDLGEADRSNKFTADKTLPESWYKVRKADYQYPSYGFDRGHICPSADRTLTKEDNEVTFLMTNMLPQAPDCNRIVWKDLESYERQLALQGNELYIFAGGAGRGGIGDKGYFDQIIIGDNGDKNGDRPLNNSEDFPLAILVPEFCWKIIVVLPEGEDDLNRINENTRIICVCIPNQQGCQNNGSWEQYECSVDYIEEITQLDFLELLPDELEDFLER